MIQSFTGKWELNWVPPNAPRLRTDYGLVADRESVSTILKTLDPDDVERRSKPKLKRRKYRSKGPNYIWHNPRIVGKYFLDCVVQVKGTPDLEYVVAMPVKKM